MVPTEYLMGYHFRPFSGVSSGGKLPVDFADPELKQFGLRRVPIEPIGSVGAAMNYALGARIAHAGDDTPTPFRTLNPLAVRL